MSDALRYDIKKFVFNHAPTGSEVAQLVWDNDLGGYIINIERVFNEQFTTGMQLTLNKYHWEVTLERIEK